MSGQRPNENKTVQVDSVWELDFLKWGDDLVVTPSESCPMQQVEVIKTICSRRGFIFQDREVTGAAPDENKSYRTVQVDSVWELDFLKWGDDLVVTPSESCPMQQVEVIKTICSRRGFIFQDREVTGAAPDENKSYRTVQVDSVSELDFLKWGDDLIVTPSESCPKQEVETIKTICSRRGFIFQDQEIPGAAGETSGASSGTGNDGETSGAGSGTGKEED